MIISEVKINVPSRIHLGLFEMGGKGYRTNGGVGFALTHPRIVVSAIRSEGFRVEDRRKAAMFPLDQSAASIAYARVINEFPLAGGAHFSISGEFESHCGLGSGTAIALAVVEGLSRLYDLDLSESTMKRLSGRGGTSGVGINTYFHGGTCIDIGLPGVEEKLASSDREDIVCPTLLARSTCPDWHLLVVFPDCISPVSKSTERDLFRFHTPVRHQSVLEAVYHGVMGIYGAILDQDFVAFCRAISAMQKTQWKSAEWELHGMALREVERELRMLGASAVALSSLGPGLVAPFESLAAAQHAHGGLKHKSFLSSFSNIGRSVDVHEQFA